MPKGHATGRDVMAMILCGVDPAWRVSPMRVLSLHTADPSKGTQSTAEATFDGYARRGVMSGDFWVRKLDGSYTNSQRIVFPTCLSTSSNIITHVAVGLDLVGAGQVLYVGPLSTPFVVMPDHAVTIPPNLLNFTEI
jgi:hypothetical protein